MKLYRLMLIAALVAAVATAAACETSVSTGGTTRYKNDEYKFSFEIVDQYEQADSATSAQSNRGADFDVAFTDPDGTVAGDQMIDGMMVSVYTLQKEVTPELMPVLEKELNSALGQLSVADPSVKMGPLKPTTVNGLQGYTADYTMDMSGTPVESRTYFLINGATEYQVTIQSSVEHWSANEPDLQKAVDSFKAE